MREMNFPIEAGVRSLNPSLRIKQALKNCQLRQLGNLPKSRRILSEGPFKAAASFSPLSFGSKIMGKIENRSWRVAHSPSRGPYCGFLIVPL